jgi:hypothetical protein
MNVQEFLVFFRKEIPNSDNIEWSIDDYQKWHPIFYELTSNLHDKVKQSYFEQTNLLIDENNFQKYYGIGTLSEFAYLGLFEEKDEVEFSNLIRKLTNKLDKTENESEIKDILDFIYNLADFLLHEYYPVEESELRKTLIELKMKIQEKNKYDCENIGELVIRFIDLMI